MSDRKPFSAVVTGAAGFLGRHLVEALRRRADVSSVVEITRGSTAEMWERALADADVVFHLAGVNRPADPLEFVSGNTELTAGICRMLKRHDRRPMLVHASSRLAAEDSAYGRSKRAAEEAISNWSAETGGRAVVFRLKNIFGKWCRPNYNSVTATFCHNISNGLPISISNPALEIELVYIDDVIAALLGCMDRPVSGFEVGEVATAYRVTLAKLAATIAAFRESRDTLVLPSLEGDFLKRLYATYLSYLEPSNFAYNLKKQEDPRGSLAEFMKSAHFGQLFVSRTKPGITRGNHYHQTKTEKFLVLEGQAVVRFRSILGGEVIEYHVNGRDYRVVDIPPGYAHSIENVGDGELVTLFWASEVFDPQRTDTIMSPVLPPS
jgi:UDP-2-acetamido-2,6-beta-L-arabino-hexul-4-ose reductase